MDVAYHECGHVLISTLFDEFFEFEFVTINAAESKEFDTLSNGGVKGRLKKKGIDLTLIEHDGLVLTFLAGLCTDDLVQNNFKFDPSWLEVSHWSVCFDRDEYSGDIELFQRHFAPIAMKIKKEHRDYIIPTLNELYNLLSSESAMGLMETLRRNLIAKESKKLTHADINLILSDTIHPLWIKENQQLLKTRRTTLLDELMV